MIAERVHKTLEQSEAVDGCAKLIVAVSGGCDSVALLHLLKSLRGSFGFDLHVASLDHGLRGTAGRGDLEFVRKLAQEWGLPHSLGQVDVPQLSLAWGTGIEEAARRARYDFLAQIARQENCRCVVVGHHADDQAETILMNIIRGSGLHGLRGMRLSSPLSHHPQFKLIRPLLTVNRAELEQYCRANDLQYRQDETNSDTSYGRNFLRHEILHALSRLNPAVVSALNRLAESAAIDDHFVASQVESLAQVALRNWGDGCSISRPLFLEAHPALQRRLLRRAYHQLASGGVSLAHDRTVETVVFCQSAPTGASRDIGADLVLEIGYDEIRVQRKGSQDPHAGYRLIPADTDCALGEAQPREIAELAITVCAAPCQCESGAVLALPEGCELRLRTRRAGDRFKPKGMGGRSRKLKDWMIDRKIPRRLRDQIPLLCADGAIAAICLGDSWRLAELGTLQGTEDAATIVCLE